MANFMILFGVLVLTLCINQCHLQSFSLYAPSCRECNGTDSVCVPVNSVTYVSCHCKDGSLGNGLKCTKLVYCNDSCCEQGLYFDMSTKTCKDRNECQTGTHKCLSGDPSDCVNLHGNYFCVNDRNRQCPDKVCSPQEDCMRLTGATTPQCADPCDNYSLLDGSKRDFRINSTSRFLTDRYNIGWVKYNNNMGIKTGCVGALKCNSLHPLSLSESHPTVEEGVKMVSLYSNLDTECRTAGAIPVKACYKNNEGYYVYKFPGLLSYNVYCTENVTSPKPMPTTTTPTSTITSRQTESSSKDTNPTTTYVPPTLDPTSTTAPLCKNDKKVKLKISTFSELMLASVVSNTYAFSPEAPLYVVLQAEYAGKSTVLVVNSFSAGGNSNSGIHESVIFSGCMSNITEVHPIPKLQYQDETFGVKGYHVDGK